MEERTIDELWERIEKEDPVCLEKKKKNKEVNHEYS